MALIDEVRAVRRLPSPQMARAIRIAARVPQTRMARELNVHRLTLARWERGECLPRGDKLREYHVLLDQLREAF